MTDPLARVNSAIEDFRDELKEIPVMSKDGLEEAKTLLGEDRWNSLIGYVVVGTLLNFSISFHD